MTTDHPSSTQLETFASAGIPGSADSPMLEHLDRCEDCRCWIDTYQLLSQTLGANAHPSSEMLAQYTAHPELLVSSEREQTESHLSFCSVCRAHRDLTAKALAGARRPVWPTLSSRWSSSPVRLALAASLLLVLSLAWALRPTPVGSKPALSANLLGQSYSGTHLVEAADAITADSVRVETGGDVTFRAGDRVVLNNGFSVENGGSFQVELVPPGAKISG